MKKLLLIWLSLAFVAAPFSLARERRLVILHTNDTHSHIDPIRGGKRDGQAGVIERAAFIDSVRRAEGKSHVLLLDAGDISQGTSYFQIFNGDIEVRLVNAMRYDVMCLGNHEFDNGMDELARRLKNLKPSVVCANYDFSATPLKDYVKPYVIVRRGGMKIGIIGLLCDISSVVSSTVVSSIPRLDNFEVVNSLAGMLRNDKKCDLVIALTHIGYEGEPFIDPVLAAGSRNLDIIVGGHSHTFLNSYKTVKDLDGKGVVIVTDGNWGYNVGKLTITK